jgi:cytochrome P450
LSLMVAARDSEGRLTEEEALGLAVLLLIAGSDTTGTLITNGTLALLRYPGEAAKLRADPALMPNAIEEFLRYDSVVHWNAPRIPTEAPISLANDTVEIQPGEQILPLVASANRDPSQFDRAEQLDLTRPNANHHMGFGHGLHLCLGANLARLNGSVAFAGVLRRIKAIEVLEDPLPWTFEGNIRKLQRLEVAITPS